MAGYQVKRKVERELRLAIIGLHYLTVPVSWHPDFCATMDCTLCVWVIKPPFFCQAAFIGIVSQQQGKDCIPGSWKEHSRNEDCSHVRRPCCSSGLGVHFLTEQSYMGQCLHEQKEVESIDLVQGFPKHWFPLEISYASVIEFKHKA